MAKTRFIYKNGKWYKGNDTTPLPDNYVFYDPALKKKVKVTSNNPNYIDVNAELKTHIGFEPLNIFNSKSVFPTSKVYRDIDLYSTQYTPRSRKQLLDNLHKIYDNRPLEIDKSNRLYMLSPTTGTGTLTTGLYTDNEELQLLESTFDKNLEEDAKDYNSIKNKLLPIVTLLSDNNNANTIYSETPENKQALNAYKDMFSDYIQYLDNFYKQYNDTYLPLKKYNMVASMLSSLYDKPIGLLYVEDTVKRLLQNKKELPDEYKKALNSIAQESNIIFAKKYPDEALNYLILAINKYHKKMIDRYDKMRDIAYNLHTGKSLEELKNNNIQQYLSELKNVLGDTFIMGNNNMYQKEYENLTKENIYLNDIYALNQLEKLKLQNSTEYQLQIDDLSLLWRMMMKSSYGNYEKNRETILKGYDYKGDFDNELAIKEWEARKYLSFLNRQNILGNVAYQDTINEMQDADAEGQTTLEKLGDMALGWGTSAFSTALQMSSYIGITNPFTFFCSWAGSFIDGNGRGFMLLLEWSYNWALNNAAVDWAERLSLTGYWGWDNLEKALHGEKFSDDEINQLEDLYKRRYEGNGMSEEEAEEEAKKDVAAYRNGAIRKNTGATQGKIIERAGHETDIFNWTTAGNIISVMGQMLPVAGATRLISSFGEGLNLLGKSMKAARLFTNASKMERASYVGRNNIALLVEGSGAATSALAPYVSAAALDAGYSKSLYDSHLNAVLGTIYNNPNLGEDNAYLSGYTDEFKKALWALKDELLSTLSLEQLLQLGKNAEAIYKANLKLLLRSNREVPVNQNELRNEAALTALFNMLAPILAKQMVEEGKDKAVEHALVTHALVSIPDILTANNLQKWLYSDATSRAAQKDIINNAKEGLYHKVLGKLYIAKTGNFLEKWSPEGLVDRAMGIKHGALKDVSPIRDAKGKITGYKVGANTISTRKYWTNQALKGIIGGFISNYLQDVGVGTDNGAWTADWNGYLEALYDPKNNINAVNIFSAGLAGAFKSAGEWQSFYDGMLGGLAGFLTPRISWGVSSQKSGPGATKSQRIKLFWTNRLNDIKSGSFAPLQIALGEKWEHSSDIVALKNVNNVRYAKLIEDRLNNGGLEEFARAYMQEVKADETGDLMILRLTALLNNAEMIQALRDADWVENEDTKDGKYKKVKDGNRPNIMVVLEGLKQHANRGEVTEDDIKALLDKIKSIQLLSEFNGVRFDDVKLQDVLSEKEYTMLLDIRYINSNTSKSETLKEKDYADRLNKILLQALEQLAVYNDIVYAKDRAGQALGILAELNPVNVSAYARSYAAYNSYSREEKRLRKELLKVKKALDISNDGVSIDEGPNGMAAVMLASYGNKKSLLENRLAAVEKAINDKITNINSYRRQIKENSKIAEKAGKREAKLRKKDYRKLNRKITNESEKLLESLSNLKSEYENKIKEVDKSDRSQDEKIVEKQALKNDYERNKESLINEYATSQQLAVSTDAIVATSASKIAVELEKNARMEETGRSFTEKEKAEYAEASDVRRQELEDSVTSLEDLQEKRKALKEAIEFIESYEKSNPGKNIEENVAITLEKLRGMSEKELAVLSIILEKPNNHFTARQKDIFYKRADTVLLVLVLQAANDLVDALLAKDEAQAALKFGVQYSDFYKSAIEELTAKQAELFEGVKYKNFTDGINSFADFAKKYDEEENDIRASDDSSEVKARKLLALQSILKDNPFMEEYAKRAASLGEKSGKTLNTYSNWLLSDFIALRKSDANDTVTKNLYNSGRIILYHLLMYGGKLTLDGTPQDNNINTTQRLLTEIRKALTELVNDDILILDILNEIQQLSGAEELMSKQDLIDNVIRPMITFIDNRIDSLKKVTKDNDGKAPEAPPAPKSKESEKGEKTITEVRRTKLIRSSLVTVTYTANLLNQLIERLGIAETTDPLTEEQQQLLLDILKQVILSDNPTLELLKEQKKFEEDNPLYDILGALYGKTTITNEREFENFFSYFSSPLGNRVANFVTNAAYSIYGNSFNLSRIAYTWQKIPNVKEKPYIVKMYEHFKVEEFLTANPNLSKETAIFLYNNSEDVKNNQPNYNQALNSVVAVAIPISDTRTGNPININGTNYQIIGFLPMSDANGGNNATSIVRNQIVKLNYTDKDWHIILDESNKAITASFATTTEWLPAGKEGAEEAQRKTSTLMLLMASESNWSGSNYFVEQSDGKRSLKFSFSSKGNAFTTLVTPMREARSKEIDGEGNLSEGKTIEEVHDLDGAKAVSNFNTRTKAFLLKIKYIITQQESNPRTLLEIDSSINHSMATNAKTNTEYNNNYNEGAYSHTTTDEERALNPTAKKTSGVCLEGDIYLSNGYSYHFLLDSNTGLATISVLTANKELPRLREEVETKGRVEINGVVYRNVEDIPKAFDIEGASITFLYKIDGKINDDLIAEAVGEFIYNLSQIHGEGEDNSEIAHFQVAYGNMPKSDNNFIEELRQKYRKQVLSEGLLRFPAVVTHPSVTVTSVQDSKYKKWQEEQNRRVTTLTTLNALGETVEGLKPKPLPKKHVTLETAKEIFKEEFHRLPHVKELPVGKVVDSGINRNTAAVGNAVDTLYRSIINGKTPEYKFYSDVFTESEFNHFVNAISLIKLFAIDNHLTLVSDLIGVTNLDFEKQLRQAFANTGSTAPIMARFLDSLWMDEDGNFTIIDCKTFTGSHINSDLLIEYIWKQNTYAIYVNEFIDKYNREHPLQRLGKVVSCKLYTIPYLNISDVETKETTDKNDYGKTIYKVERLGKKELKTDDYAETVTFDPTTNQRTIERYKLEDIARWLNDHPEVGSLLATKNPIEHPTEHPTKHPTDRKVDLTTPKESRYLVSTETGSGESSTMLDKGDTRRNGLNKGLGDHRSIGKDNLPKGWSLVKSALTSGKLTGDRADEILILKGGDESHPITTVVYRNSNVLHGSRGNAGIVLNIAGDFSDMADLLISLFNNDAAIKEILNTVPKTTKTGEQSPFLGTWLEKLVNSVENIINPKPNPNKPFTSVESTYTSKSGKTLTGKYVDTVDSNGVHHIRFEGSSLAKRHFTTDEMLLKGITVDDVIGKKEEYKEESNYDKAKAEFDGFSVESITIHPDGRVVINTGNDVIQGEAALKILDKMFPEFSPNPAIRIKTFVGKTFRGTVNGQIVHMKVTKATSESVLLEATYYNEEGQEVSKQSAKQNIKEFLDSMDENVENWTDITNILPKNTPKDNTDSKRLNEETNNCGINSGGTEPAPKHGKHKLNEDYDDDL